MIYTHQPKFSDFAKKKKKKRGAKKCTRQKHTFLPGGRTAHNTSTMILGLYNIKLKTVAVTLSPEIVRPEGFEGSRGDVLAIQTTVRCDIEAPILH